MRRALLVAGLLLAAYAYADAPPPMSSIAVIAWMGGWEAMRSPSVPAPAADGATTGDLEKAFRVEWKRDGQAFHVKITKVADAWVGRLAIEFRFAPDTGALTYGDADCPVRVRLSDAKQGQIVWAWEYGAQAWLIGERGQERSGVVLDGTTTHGFFVDKYPDGAYVVHCNLDWPKAVGQTIEAGFRLAPGAKASELQADRRKRLSIASDPPLNEAKIKRLRAEGLVRVDKAGWGFQTADGKPFRILGQNRSHLALFSPAEQEKILAEYDAAGLTVTRLLIADYAFRPMGQWNDEAYRRLLATVERCASHGIRVVICLEYSACGGQYNVSIHHTPNWSDLYTMPEMLEWYKGTVERVVKPLRGNPAVMAYDVTNEPDVALTPATPTLLNGWRGWLRTKYGTSSGAAHPPSQDDYDWQKTQEARDFFAFGGEAIGRSMIARAKIVRAVDPDNLVTISAWDPRLLRGLPGAEIFDFWAPHSYEIYFVGREISDQVMYQLGALRRALPDRPRPVVIEEFGLVEGDPKFPDTMKAEHARAFLEAGERWGVGIMIWSDLTPPLLSEFAAASRRKPLPQTDGPGLAFYVPHAEECRVLIYPMYMWRRAWGEALASAQEAGFRAREVVKPADAKGCKALLVLGDSLPADEEKFVRDLKLPTVMVPSPDGVKRTFAGAQMLPADWAAQVALWKGMLP